MDIIGAIAIVSAIACRILSGVHWFTDIIGAIILSLLLISIYLFLLKVFCKKKVEINDQEKKSN